MITSQVALTPVSSGRRTVDMATIFFIALATIVFVAAFYSAAVHPSVASAEMITFTGP